MTPEERANHLYLGDGAYAEFNRQSGQMILRTGDHRDRYCDNKIYLDPNMVTNLYKFMCGLIAGTIKPEEG